MEKNKKMLSDETIELMLKRGFTDKGNGVYVMNADGVKIIAEDGWKNVLRLTMESAIGEKVKVSGRTFDEEHVFSMFWNIGHDVWRTVFLKEGELEMAVKQYKEKKAEFIKDHGAAACLVLVPNEKGEMQKLMSIKERIAKEIEDRQKSATLAPGAKAARVAQLRKEIMNIKNKG